MEQEKLRVAVASGSRGIALTIRPPGQESLCKPVEITHDKFWLKSFVLSAIRDDSPPRFHHFALGLSPELMR
ncbi:hypothetical protein [Dickeya solani]|uniref:hypothetical protein n=1 Tax=Dickeya solani TaxID=1089444 RepID=UPI0003A6731B|nr:hypothetical protein [Dickeya solani]MBJ2331619.1 hypothetical protein [Dickeya solani]MBJ2338247.1 hypothetical protein [Dickeya solani]MBJ2341442.1 hypothetical protein [Dickeya solani]MBJ2351558.1 hypothetical protein [Dickeya solani]MCZ0783650.1 hypothetical protein [Dickeya solani]